MSRTYIMYITYFKSERCCCKCTIQIQNKNTTKQ